MSISTHWLITTSTALLLAAAACEAKDGDDTGASSDASTTGDDSTTGGSESASSTGGSDATGGSGVSGTATSTGTSGDSTTVADTGDMTDSDPTATSSTTVATSSSSSGDPTGDPTTDSDTDTGVVDPPEPCVGDPKELELVTSMAYLKSQIPPDMTTSGGSSSSSTGGDEPDPKTLYIRLSSQIYSCKDPTANLECGPEWGVTIVIPPEFQTPGAIYNLEGQDVFAVFSETGADEGGNMCSFGGGSGGGTFQILDIDQNQVKGRLCNVPEWFWFDTKPDLEGTFVADRC